MHFGSFHLLGTKLDYRRRGELCFDYDKALKVWNRYFVTDIVMCLVVSVFDGGYHIAVIYCRYTVIMLSQYVIVKNSFQWCT